MLSQLLMFVNIQATAFFFFCLWNFYWLSRYLTLNSADFQNSSNYFANKAQVKLFPHLHPCVGQNVPACL